MKALFHTDHANLATGVGSALGITALSAARTAKRLQTGVDGVSLIDASPKYLVVPASLQTTAEALVAALYAPTISDVNVFAGKLEVITEPRLDAVSTTRWYLAADQNLVPSLEVAYLAGQPGPQIVSRVGFEILGVETRVTLDFGAGAVDHRDFTVTRERNPHKLSSGTPPGERPEARTRCRAGGAGRACPAPHTRGALPFVGLR